MTAAVAVVTHRPRHMTAPSPGPHLQDRGTQCGDWEVWVKWGGDGGGGIRRWVQWSWRKPQIRRRPVYWGALHDVYQKAGTGSYRDSTYSQEHR